MAAPSVAAYLGESTTSSQSREKAEQSICSRAIRTVKRGYSGRILKRARNAGFTSARGALENDHGSFHSVNVHPTILLCGITPPEQDDLNILLID